MTQYERMISGLPFDVCDKEIMEMQSVYQNKLQDLVTNSPYDPQARIAYMKEVLAECGEGSYFELPFNASWGGKNVHFGKGV